MGDEVGRKETVGDVTGNSQRCRQRVKRGDRRRVLGQKKGAADREEGVEGRKRRGGQENGISCCWDYGVRGRQ